MTKMWLQFKRANTKCKIQVLLFVTHFHISIIVSFNSSVTHQPRFHNQCQLGPIWGLRSPLIISLHFLIHCIETTWHLPPILWKVGGGGGHIILFMVNIWLVSECSALKKNVNLTRDLKPFLFVCLFVLFCFSIFQASPFPVHTKIPPSPHTHTLSDPFLKLYLRLCNPLLRHCICIMYRKHRIGRKAVNFLEI